MGVTLEDVIKGLECRLDVNGSKFTHCLTCDYRHDVDHCQWTCQTDGILEDALALLKAQEKATIEPKRIDLDDETKACLDKMDAVDALGNIADICIDWDGYRTADGLGGLINEIWAYARYCADRLLKAQEARVMTVEEVNALDWDYCYLEQERLPGKEYRGMLGKYIMTCVTWPSITAAKISYGSDGYGKRWRCWTSRPSDEVRRATPWK